MLDVIKNWLVNIYVEDDTVVAFADDSLLRVKKRGYLFQVFIGISGNNVMAFNGMMEETLDCTSPSFLIDLTTLVNDMLCPTPQ